MQPLSHPRRWILGFAIATVASTGASVVLLRGANPRTILSNRPVRPPTTLPAAAPDARDLDVKYMLRGYCYAGTYAADPNAPGGFAPSDNFPKPIDATVPGAPAARALILHADLTTPVAFGPTNNGLRLLLINRTGKPQWLNASDSRLSIIQEAKAADGTWKPIEYLPSSWCGNSYHRVQVGRDEYWDFAAPRYTGPLPTKLRFALRLSDTQTLHSNEFDGSINPEQFTTKQGHTPTNIMDPYDD